VTSYEDADEALAQLEHHWGTAYAISHPQPGAWVAQRRDNDATITATDPDTLFAQISADYIAHPVPRGEHPYSDEPSAGGR
jgi:hypothetical protein